MKISKRQRFCILSAQQCTKGADLKFTLKKRFSMVDCLLEGRSAGTLWTSSSSEASSSWAIADPLDGLTTFGSTLWKFIRSQTAWKSCFLEKGVVFVSFQLPEVFALLFSNSPQSNLKWTSWSNWLMIEDEGKLVMLCHATLSLVEFKSKYPTWREFNEL